jgi:opacity protein-like surface antigen
MKMLLRTVMLSVLVTAAASAQDAPARKGFSASFGLGNGSAGADCDFCSDDRENGFSGYLRLGGYLRPNLLLAGETNGWVHSEDGVDENLSFVTGVAQWYPAATNGFYLKGGLGLAMYRASDDVDDVSGNALAVNLGLGYDFRVARSFALTPYVNYLASTKGELSVNDVGTDLKVSANVLQIGLGFTWH